MDRARAELTRRFALAALLVLSMPALAEREDPDRCLTPEQRAELARRAMESVSVMVLEARTRRPPPPEATAIHESANRALAECEARRGADQCEGTRSAAQGAARALEAAKAEDFAKFRREMPAKITERVKAIRKEFPACD